MAMRMLVKTHQRFWQLDSTWTRTGTGENLLERWAVVVAGHKTLKPPKMQRTLVVVPGNGSALVPLKVGKRALETSTWSGATTGSMECMPLAVAVTLEGFGCHVSPVSLEFTISGSDSVLLGELRLSMRTLQGGMFRVHALAEDSAVDA